MVINLIYLYEDERPAKNFRKVQSCIAQAHISVANKNAKSVTNENAKRFIIFLERTAFVPGRLMSMMIILYG